MNNNDILALQGELASPFGQPTISTVNLINPLPLSVNLSWFDADSNLIYFTTVPAGATLTYNNLISSQTWFMPTLAATGSFIGVFQTATGVSSYTVSLDASPNDIGPLPEPTTDIIIPPDGPRVLIAIGTAANGNVVVREQYWERMSQSYSLAAGETRTYSTTTTEGSQSTTSEQATVAESLGLSATAGWGPISASVSSSISRSTTAFQSYTVSDRVSSYVSDTVTNPGTSASTFFVWQLTDVVTVFSAGGTALSGMIMGENPLITSGPWDQSAQLIPENGGVPQVKHRKPLSRQAVRMSGATPAKKEATPRRKNHARGRR